MNSYIIISLGFFAQFLFFARTIAQWFKSEQQGVVISPVIYWQISLVASLLMLTYGILRNDFAIVLGQFIVYFIYVRNLQLKKAWKTMHMLARVFALLAPFFFVVWLLFSSTHNFNSILKNEDVPYWLLVWGSLGQIVFTSRFFYQWIYSENRKDSVLPLGFWVISAVGSLMIFTYSIPRLDPVLFASQSLGLFIYVRNILLHYGKGSLFSKFDKIPFLNKIIGKVSDQIK